MREEGSDAIARWLREAPVAVSSLSQVEITSAICRRQREGTVSLEQKDRVLQALPLDFGSWINVEVSQPVLREASSLLERHPLKAADAIQLASALYLRDQAETEVTFGSFDQRLNDAAREEGFTLLP